MCYNSCNECPRKIFSTDVLLDTTGTLVIDIPAQTFVNRQRGCLVITQAFPDETTITAPVAISIGGDTTTLYPLLDCSGAQVIASRLRTRRRYPFKVTTTATGGSFVILKNLSCGPDDTLSVIPAVEGG